MTPAFLMFVPEVESPNLWKS